jgi:DNA polymerase IIIc chi subunit
MVQKKERISSLGQPLREYGDNTEICIVTYLVKTIRAEPEGTAVARERFGKYASAGTSMQTQQ